MGRPRNPLSLNNVISASVTTERRNLISKLATEQNTTISAIVNSALDLYFKNGN